jgi:class 3 adenylate cyclase
MTQQANVQTELQKRVQETSEIQQARKEGKLIARFTGDGMALIFLRDLLSPVRCALQLQNALKSRDAEIRKSAGAPIILRMGIHSGSVLLVEDMNEQSDVAGEGIIVAQRVMDCGDAGHILLSDEMARKLRQIDPWPRYLKDFGECRVKHGVTVHLYNLYGRFDGQYCGNPAMPRKVAADEAARAQELKRFRGTLFERNPGVLKWIKALCVLAALGGGGYATWQRSTAVRQFVSTAYGNVIGGDAPAPAPKTAKRPGKQEKAKPDVAHKATRMALRPSPQVVAPRTAEIQRVLVPDLLGKTMDEAASLLRADGLRVTRSPKSGFNSEYPEGAIYRQSPASGSFINAGKPVFVRISKGDPPDPTTVEETDDTATPADEATEPAATPTPASPAPQAGG